MNFTEDILPILLVGAFALLIAGPVILVVRGAFRRHDPQRAVAAVTLDGAGDFRLELPPGIAGTLCFRFEIDGDTDNDYDLVVRGAIERDGEAVRSFAWRTKASSRVDGAAAAQHVTSTYAVSGSMGSFELTSVERAGGVVVGTVAEGTPGLLKRGWVYVPKED